MKRTAISRDVRAHPSTVIFEWKSEIMLHAVNSSNVLHTTDFNVLYVYNKNVEYQYNVLEIHVCIMYICVTL